MGHNVIMENVWIIGQVTLTQMRAVDWNVLECKTCGNTQYHKGWRSTECRSIILSETVPDTIRLWRSRRDFWTQELTVRVLDWLRITMRSDRDMSSLCNKDHHSNLEWSDIRRMTRSYEVSASSLQRSWCNRGAKSSETCVNNISVRVGRINGHTVGNMQLRCCTDGCIRSCTDRNSWHAGDCHSFSTPTDARHDSSYRHNDWKSFQAHKDMNVSSRERARKKQIDLRTIRYAIHVWTPGGNHEDFHSVESQVDSARLRRISKWWDLLRSHVNEGVRMELSRRLVMREKSTKRSWETTHKLWWQRWSTRRRATLRLVIWRTEIKPSSG